MSRAPHFVLLAAALLVCSAHVGSPDAWYDGPAGPYRVLVHIQAPGVVPGIATVNVRVADARVTRVTAFINKFDATGGTPPPDVAAPVADQPGWYRTRLWVMSPGSNSVTVAVHGPNGVGTTVVPLVAVPTRRLGFDSGLALILGGLSGILLLGLLTIIGAAVREGTLPPGVEPDAARRHRARRASARALLVIALVLTGGAFWWRLEDARFAQSMLRPMAASATTNGSDLVLMVTDSAWVHRNDEGWGRRAPGSSALSPLIEDHGKIMHAFVISTDGQSAFAHLHPVTRDSVRFDAALPPLPAGEYRVYGDLVHSSGLTQTLVARLVLDSAARQPAMPTDPDDAWARGSATSARANLPDGGTLRWLQGDRPRVSGEEAGLRFVVEPPPGEQAALELYLGMPGHAVVVRDDGNVFIHLHPLGTISMAAQRQLAGGNHSSVTAAVDTLYFPYAFPEPGKYTVWVQLKRNGRILTANFRVEVLSRTVALARCLNKDSSTRSPELLCRSQSFTWS